MKWRSLLILIVLLTPILIGSGDSAEKKRIKNKAEVPPQEITKVPTIKYLIDPNESLKGLKGLGLLIEPLHPDIEPSGLNRNRIQQWVELKFRKAGIPIHTDEERLREPGKPYLYVNLNAYSWREEVIYGYSLKVDLNQLVLLDRQRTTGCFGATWSSGSAGIVGANQFERLIEMEINTAVDKFIKDYLLVNPDTKSETSGDPKGR